MTYNKFYFSTVEDELERERPATVAAGLDVDSEHALEALCPRHGGTPLGGCLRDVIAGAPAASPRCHLRTQRAVGRKNAMEAREVDPGVDRGINCVLNYTVAFTLFALKAILAPFLPNNEGAMRPITVRAPQGSILNVLRPAAVVGRTSVGQFIPQLVFNALPPVVPQRVLAESGSMPLWWLTLAGHHRDGRPFVVGPTFSGGLGAGSDVDGVSCLTFPANIKNTPVELLETDSPVLVERREFIVDSGRPGRFRGGLGQEFVLRVPDDETAPQGPIVEFLLGGRLATAAQGLRGGQAGAMASVSLNGEAITWGAPYLLHPGDRISYRTAGGGGHGPPRERDPALVEREIADGLISPASARSIYGYEPSKG